MLEDKKIIMIAAANSAISYKRQNPNAGIEEVIKYVMREVKSERELKVFGIAAASFVLNYLEKNPKASEREVMQSFSNESNNIIISIENQEEII